MRRESSDTQAPARWNWAAWRVYLFAPPLVLGVSLAAALVFAALVVVLFEGEARRFLLYYFVPIAVPFAAFLFDRAEHWHELTRTQVRIDLPILALALIRAVFLIPLISGHALFLIYALMTTRSGVARLTALLVLIEVVYIKTFMWHDVTLLGGLALGLGAAALFKKTGANAIRPAVK